MFFAIDAYEPKEAGVENDGTAAAVEVGRLVKELVAARRTGAEALARLSREHGLNLATADRLPVATRRRRTPIDSNETAGTSGDTGVGRGSVTKRSVCP